MISSFSNTCILLMPLLFLPAGHSPEDLLSLTHNISQLWVWCTAENEFFSVDMINKS